MDWTFDPDPKRKGTYYRKIDDIQRGLNELSADSLPEPARFIALYFGCEKLAKLVIGIDLRRSATDDGDGKLHLNQLRAAISATSLPFAPDQIDRLFSSGRGDIGDAFAHLGIALVSSKDARGTEMPLKTTLDDMQNGLHSAMDALKRGDNKEAERILLEVGRLLDKLIRASK